MTTTLKLLFEHALLPLAIVMGDGLGALGEDLEAEHSPHALCMAAATYLQYLIVVEVVAWWYC